MNKLNIFLLTFFFIFSINSSAQIDQYQSDIVKLLNCNGTIEKYDFEYKKTLTWLRVRIAAENTPLSFWNSFRETKKESLNELIAIQAFAYRKYFSHDEIKVLLNFYSSSAATKLMKNKEVTSEEKALIDNFNESKLANKIDSISEDFEKDTEKIAREWKKELFAKGMGALAKAGYTKWRLTWLNNHNFYQHL